VGDLRTVRTTPRCVFTIHSVGRRFAQEVKPRPYSRSASPAEVSAYARTSLAHNGGDDGDVWGGQPRRAPVGDGGDIIQVRSMCSDEAWPESVDRRTDDLVFSWLNRRLRAPRVCPRSSALGETDSRHGRFPPEHWIVRSSVSLERPIAIRDSSRHVCRDEGSR